MQIKRRSSLGGGNPPRNPCVVQTSLPALKMEGREDKLNEVQLYEELQAFLQQHLAQQKADLPALMPPPSGITHDRPFPQLREQTSRATASPQSCTRVKSRC